MVFCNQRVLCRASGSVVLLLGLASFTACAEIEVGAEAAKRISRTAGETGSASAKNASDSGEIELAQATDGQGEDLPISPFLEPAPQLFEATGLAVWDGKRTLQGVWVAHPLAESARRVRIFNEENGKAVDGALFKRDSTAEDATVLISSEAAQLLSMGIGTPALIRIVAVSPIQRQPGAPTEVVVAGAQSPDSGNEAGASSEDDVAKVADSAGTATTDVAEATDENSSAPETASTDEVEDKVAEAATQVATEDNAEALAATAQKSVVTKTEPSTATALSEDTSDVVSAERTTETVQPLQPAASSTEPEAETETTEAEPKKAEPAAVEAEPEPMTDVQEAPRVAAIEPAKPARPAKSSAQQSTSPLRLPFVQAGIFGVKSNATNLIRRIEAKDLPAFGREIKSGGKTLTKVLAGPFQTSDERNAALRTIRAMGLKDAAPVRR